MHTQSLYDDAIGCVNLSVSSPGDQLEACVSDLMKKVQSALASRQSLAQEFDQLGQVHSQQTASLKSSHELAGALTAERDNLRAELQQLQVK